MKLLIVAVDVVLLCAAITQLFRELKASYVPMPDPWDVAAADTEGIRIGNISKIVLWTFVISTTLLALIFTI